MSRSSGEKPSATPSAGTAAQRVPDRTAGQSEGRQAAARAMFAVKIAGKPLPEWDDYTDEAHAIWRAQADSVVDAYLAAASPVGVEGEDERLREALEKIRRVPVVGCGLALQAQRQVQRITRAALAASPSSPTGPSEDGLAKALMVAIGVHAGQVDKQGEPYLLHVLRVVEAVSDAAKPVAALHDTVEDAGTHLYGARLASETGADYWALMALTRSETSACEKHSGETYADYIACIAEHGNAIAREVKLADLRDNLGRIPSTPGVGDANWASLRRRYEKAIAALTAAGGDSHDG